MFNCVRFHVLFEDVALSFMRGGHLDVHCTDIDMKPLMMSQGDMMIWFSRQQCSLSEKVKD